MAEENEEPIVDIEQAYSKSEEYIIENKKSIQIIVGAAIAIIALYFVYKNVVQGPKIAEAQGVIWKAEQAFENDSFAVAVNGTNAFAGFKEIAEEYGSTPTGNLANAYAGICYLQLGDFDAAINYLSNYDGTDEMISPVAIGGMGDAYAELGEKEAALKQYELAADLRQNNYTAPLYHQKAGQMAEILGDFNKAIEHYSAIKSEYPESQQANNVDKYIARAKAAK